MVIHEVNATNSPPTSPAKPALTRRQVQGQLSVAEDQLAGLQVALLRQETRLLLVFSRWQALRLKRQRLLRKIRRIKDSLPRPSKRGL